MNATLDWSHPVERREVEVPVSRGFLGATLHFPARPRAVVILAEPSGIRRLGYAERFLADHLARAGFLTLLVDLLTEEEDVSHAGAHDDVPLLADRLLRAARWLGTDGADPRLPLGYFGVGASAAAALVATAIEPGRGRAVVSRGGRPDSAGAALLLTRAPSLFIVAGHDARELAANRAACGLFTHRRMEVVRSETGDLAEGAALDRVSALSIDWFTQWLDPAAGAGARC